MYLLINFLILILTLFFYIHINNFIRTSDYLEIYEIENPSKDELNDFCKMKQPLLIKNLDIDNLMNINTEFITNNYNSFEIFLYNNYTKKNTFLSFDKCTELFKKDLSGQYISFGNNLFLNETTLYKHLKNYDNIFRPMNTFESCYDIISGSIDSNTPLKCEYNIRNLFIVTEGNVEIMMCPPINNKFLYTYNDYEKMEQISNINIKNIEKKYESNYRKIKFLKLNLSKGDIVNIPPYWYYTIIIKEDKTILLNYKYKTFINIITLIPNYLLCFIQKNNTKEILSNILDSKLINKTN